MNDHTVLAELCLDLAVGMEWSRSYIPDAVPAEVTGVTKDPDCKDVVDIATGCDCTAKSARCGYTNQM